MSLLIATNVEMNLFFISLIKVPISEFRVGSPEPEKVI